MPMNAPRATKTGALPDEVDEERRSFLRQLQWIALTSGVLGGCGGSGSGSGSSAPPKADAPNILAIVIDDLNDWVGFLGTNPQVKSPNMDALAARSTVFRRNYCNVPLCNPSRSSFWSGLSPQHTQVFDNVTSLHTMVPTAVNLPDYLAASGYASALYGKVYHTYKAVQEPYPPQVPDRNLVCSGYGSLATEGLFDWGGMDVDDTQMPDYVYTQQGIDFLNAASTDRPFFLAVGLVRTHVAWYVPQKWLDMFPLASIQVPVVPPDDLADVPAEGQALALKYNFQSCIERQGKWAEAVQAYLASIAFVDAQVGRLLAALDASPHKDDTIVVLLSDNGFHLGQKLHWHKEALWEATTRVPLVIHDRGQTTGANVDAAVSLLDLCPTLLDLCGLEGPYPMDGTSLRPLLQDPSMPWDKPVLMTYGVTDLQDRFTGFFDYAVRSNDYRYIQYDLGGRELYVEASDPGELTNVAADPGHAALIAQLAAYIPT
jgi:arylsulfatase A-like enzyme